MSYNYCYLIKFIVILLKVSITYFQYSRRYFGIKKDKFIDSVTTTIGIILTSSFMCWQTGSFSWTAFIYPSLELMAYVVSAFVKSKFAANKSCKLSETKKQNSDVNDMFQVVVVENPRPPGRPAPLGNLPSVAYPVLLGDPSPPGEPTPAGKLPPPAYPAWPPPKSATGQGDPASQRLHMPT